MSYTQRRRFLWILFLIGCALTAIVAEATTFIRLSFGDLVRYSSAIARVRCLGSQTLQERGEIWTDTHFLVIEQHKGALPAEIVVRHPGGRLLHLQSHVDGVPQFRQGEEAYLFLRGVPGKPLRIVGWIQGTFRVGRSALSGSETVTQDSASVPIFDPKSNEFTTEGVRNLPLATFEARLRQAGARSAP